jgi:hypothetical protein
MQPLRGRPVTFGHARDGEQHVDVGFDLFANVRPQHLDDHGAPVRQRRRMHLGHRSRRERLVLEAGEAVVDRHAERLLDQRHRRRRIEWRHMVLQQNQLVGDLRWQQIAADRDRLAELDEQRAELLECEADALAERPLAPATERQQPIQPAERPEQVGGSHDLVEPVAYQRSLDRHQPEREPDLAHA